MTQLYRNVYAPMGHPRASGTRGKDRLGVIGEHVLIVEAALGKYLPDGAEPHHVDGNGLNNKPSNLVICQDRTYHRLLHQRTKALNASGRASWRRCRFCKQYDDPTNLYISGKNGHTVNHRECFNRYERDRRAQTKRSE